MKRFPSSSLLAVLLVLLLFGRAAASQDLPNLLGVEPGATRQVIEAAWDEFAVQWLSPLLGSGSAVASRVTGAGDDLALYAEVRSAGYWERGGTALTIEIAVNGDGATLARRYAEFLQPVSLGWLTSASERVAGENVTVGNLGTDGAATLAWQKGGVAIVVESSADPRPFAGTVIEWVRRTGLVDDTKSAPERISADSSRTPTPIEQPRQEDDPVDVGDRQGASSDADEQLVRAVSTADIDSARAALASGANPDVRDARGIPVLQLAVLRGSLEIVSLLLDRDADTEARGPMGARALHVAASSSGAYAVDMVAHLLARGAQLDARLDDVADQPSVSGATPRSLAARSGASGPWRALVSAGAVPAGGENEALLIEELAREILPPGVDTTPARLSGHLVAKMACVVLTEQGAWGDPEQAGFHVDLVRGVGLPCIGRVGTTPPLHAAAGAGNAMVVEALIDAGVNPNARYPWSSGSSTALRLAIDRGDGNMARLLFERGANPMLAAADPVELPEPWRSRAAKGRAAYERFLDAWAAWREGDLHHARELLTDDVVDRVAKARTLLGLVTAHGPGADAAAAVEHYRLAAAVNEPLATRLLGAAYQRGLGVERDVDRAERTYRRLAVQSPVWGNLSLAMLWTDPTHPRPGVRSRHEVDAIDIAKRAYASEPNRTGVVYGAGYVLAALDDEVAGLSMMREAITIWGEQAGASQWLALGDAYARVGLKAQATQSWREALERGPAPGESEYLAQRLAQVSR